MFWFLHERNKQLKVIFEWLSGIVQERDLIQVDLPSKRGLFYFDFPLRYGDGPKKIAKKPQDKEVTFIIRSPSKEVLDEKWIKIFGSPEIEVFENKGRISGTPPLRWGLTDEEKKLALKISRDAITKFLVEGKRLDRADFPELPPRFFIKTDLCVVLWAGGCLRGSPLFEKQYLGEGVAVAAIAASRDPRFKPLAFEELEETRIQLTLISELKSPLSAEERLTNLIYPDKGYLLQRHEKRAWFLPEVFNFRRFRSLEEFLEYLIQEKAQLPRSALQGATTFIFEVDDFIESENHKEALHLWGPIVIRKFGLNSSFVDERLRAAADWLLRIQEPDGNIPPIIDPFSGRAVRQVDWPRLAFSAWALAEFGKAVHEEKYLSASRKTFEYLRKYLLSTPTPTIFDLELTLVYFGQLALTLDRVSDASSAAENISPRLDHLPFEPVTYAQIASFFKAHEEYDKQSLASLLTTLKERFEQNCNGKQPMSLALWAELVNTFYGIDDEFSAIVTNWLKAQQLPNGAFPASTHSSFPYTRSVSKIFEVLALAAEGHRDAIEKSLRWLLSMQYDEENTFFVPTEIRPKILGGFRHDYFNHEAWIDAAGHMLLGGARFIK